MKFIATNTRSREIMKAKTILRYTKLKNSHSNNVALNSEEQGTLIKDLSVLKIIG